MALSNDIRNLIDELADEVRKLFEIEPPIKDITEVVKKMGGQVRENVEIDGLSPGRIRKEGENSFIIEVSPFQSRGRRNFTIAHELGHLFIHMGFITDDDQWSEQTDKVYYRKGNTEEECEANEFAAAFLMPRTEYRDVMFNNVNGKTVHTQEIAKYFNVSTEAASNRGKWLGYLEW